MCDLLNSSKYISTESHLYWTSSKSMFVSGLNNEHFTNPAYNQTNRPSLDNEIYKNKNGEETPEIYDLLYTKLYLYSLFSGFKS